MFGVSPTLESAWVERRGTSWNVDPTNPQFITENPIKMDELGVPLFQETSKCIHRPTWVIHRSGELLELEDDVPEKTNFMAE